jgi:hypothetical protein
MPAQLIASFKKLTISFFCILFCLSIHAQTVFDPIQPQKKIIPTAIESFLSIDGLLNEPEWTSINGIDDFVTVSPVQGEKPSQRTIVKLAYNKVFLYIAAICMDSVKRLRVPDFKRDFFPPDHDHFAIMIDGFKDERNAMAFLFNPFGVQRDVLCFDDRFFDVEWDALWQVRTHITDAAWIAEVAIPWKTLRYPATDIDFQTWGINFCRARRSTNEYYTWSPFPRAFSLTRMSYEGLVDSLQPPRSGTNLRIQPFSLVNAHKNNLKKRWETNFKAGGEAKWAIRSNKVFDFTINTDFAQADVDQQINNVQRFSYYFPEKRPFFLENASLFKPGLDVNPDGNKGTLMVIQPFFSRRIGLDDKGQPLPIQVGARYIDRSENYNIGLMSLRQTGNDSLAPSDFFIGRYTHNIGKGNTLGALMTSRLHEPSGNQKNSYANWSGSVDGFFRFNSKLEMNGMLSGTINTGKDGGKGWAGYGQLYYKSDQFIAWWNQSFVTANYSPEIGFVNRSNVVSTSPGFYFLMRNKWLPKFARTFAPGLKSDVIQTASTGKLEEINIAAYPVWFNFHSGGSFGFAFQYQYQQLHSSFHPLNTTIEQGTYHFNQLHFFYATDASKKWSADAEYLLGGFYNGRLHYTMVGTRFSPIPHIAFRARGEQYKLKQVGMDIASADYYLYSLETRFALTPRLQLFLIYQENTSDRTKGFNSRFSWEYKPLSYVYLVFNNRAWTQNSLKQMDNTCIFKINYLRQF